MFTLFTGAMLEDLFVRGPLTWQLHTRLSDFVRNISTNISALGQRTHLKLGELSSLFIIYNITIFDFIRCIVFYFIFIAWQCTHSIADDLSFFLTTLTSFCVCIIAAKLSVKLLSCLKDKTQCRDCLSRADCYDQSSRQHDFIRVSKQLASN